MLVADGVHRFTFGVSNWYLVEDDGALTLVDSGTPADWNTLTAALLAERRTLEHVAAVLLTHAHSDHTGFAERTRKEAGARVYVHGADETPARTGRTAKAGAGMGRYLPSREAYRTLFGLLRRGAIRIVPIREVSTFADGEVLDVPGGPRAVHVPGHTAGSAAIYFETRSLICTGDSLVTRNPLTGRLGPQIMPAALNVDSDQALRSLESFQGADADLLLPGHGEPWRDGLREAVQRARAAGPS